LSAATDRSGNFLFLGSTNGGLGKGYLGSGGSIADNRQLRLGGSAVSAVAAASSGDLFVAIAYESDTAGGIVRNSAADAESSMNKFALS
jgi:hypothetical protein